MMTIKNNSHKGVLVGISNMDREIIHYISYEFSLEEISKELHLSRTEMEEALRCIMHKLDVVSIVGLIRKAFERGILLIAPVPMEMKEGEGFN